MAPADVESEELKRLLRSAKPAFAARGTTLDAEKGLTFDVLYNGHGAWMIARPPRSELLAGGRTLLVEPRGVEVIDMPVAVNNDVKSALDPKRMVYLDSALLEVQGSTVAADRPCHLIRAHGLRQDSDAIYEMAVDTQTGVVLRISLEGRPLLEVEEFRLAISPVSDSGC